MMSQRWMAVADPAFPWEREALTYVRERLPDQEPFRAWSNFEFIAEDGSINEVDLLVVSLYRVYLVEIKSRPGQVSGDAGTWTWSHDGRLHTEDNPLLLANRKAKKLKSLLQHQRALRHSRAPYIEPIIFLSAPELRCELSGAARHGVYLRQGAEPGGPDIIAVLQGATEAAARGERAPAPSIDRRLSQAVARAMEQAGIRPSQRARRVGDYTLDRLLAETDVYQDWEATHVRFARIKRRVRIYPHALHATEASRTLQRQAAEREYLVLEGIHQAGILKAESFTEHERGPALIFEHDPAAERLDLFVRERGDTLDIGRRLALVRQLAETLQYAHEHRLYHQALSPQTILVTAPTSPQPRLKIFDWQTARRGSTATGSSGHASDGSLSLALFGDQQSLLYMAPEAIAGMAFDAAKLDIFALGAVAYHIFSGRPPATSIEELQRKCYNGRGLHLSEVMDGAGQELQELIQASTCPAVEDRLESVAAFIEVLGRVEAELTAPTLEDIVHPLEARPNDRLEGGFVVKKRLGQGATSVALLVERHGREGVLKVALEPGLNARLEEEGEILRQLRHPNIVELYEQTQVSGHAALFMAVAGVDTKAGTYTLAQRLRAEGRLSLDLLQRFGEELLVVTDWLEQHGISHRDIKPDNIGVGQTPSGRLTLILFDFSLANTPVDNIRAGTPPYLDPFLRRRQPPRWDLHAERFAVAMTLYEMATGTLPIWGDGASDPAMLDCEVSIDSALFDPAVRDELTAFFARALHSDHRRRFDHAEEMLRAWRHIFASVDRPATETDHGAAIDFADALASATEDTPLSALGLSPRLLDALMRIGAQTVGELLRLPRIRLYRNQGLGQKIVKDIRSLAERVAQHFAERGDQPSTTVSEEPESDEARADPRRLSVDLLVRRALPRRLDAEDRRILTALLGLDGNGQRDAWPAQQNVAARLGVEWTVVQNVVQRARAYWGKQAWMTALREDVAAILDKHGGVATVEELTVAVLAARGSTSDEPQRSRLAAAMACAALETEMARESARYLLYRGQSRVFVVATSSLADSYAGSPTARAQYAERLGLKADELAAADPLPTPMRVVEELQTVSPPPGDPALPADRLLRLAVAASNTAALSSRLEVYPRRMSAARALKLGVGSLLGPKALTAQQVRQRIASRYPEAEPIPDPPVLDDLLRDAGLDWVWDSAVAAGQGGYRPRSVSSDVSAGTSSSRPWHLSDELSTSPEMEAAHALDARLARAVAERRFLVLTVAPRHLLHAERHLLRRFPLTRLDLEALLIQAMKATAEAVGAQWEVVLKADAAPRESPDWRRLQTLVRRSMPAVEAALFAATGPVLLVYPGLLARYDHIALLERLRDACLQGHGAPGFLVLVAADAQHQLPVLDGKPVPVIHVSEWARLSEAWLAYADGPSSPAQ
ncbi:MAG TPA: BREX system serine/threonine kinase PglW [Alphaproteobacteria bacterium]|nr:BREX system serine/threonine kinase PglW [Alphaproteobacteria bacterium]